MLNVRTIGLRMLIFTTLCACTEAAAISDTKQKTNVTFFIIIRGLEAQGADYLRLKQCVCVGYLTLRTVRCGYCALWALILLYMEIGEQIRYGVLRAI